MNKIHYIRNSLVVTAGALLIILVAFMVWNQAIAQDPDGPPVVRNDSLGVGFEPLEPIEVFPSLENEPDVYAVSTQWSYYNIAGSQLLPRQSGMEYDWAYPFCLYVTGGSGIRLSFPVLIPTGSVIKYVRIYYYDTSVSGDMTVWLTQIEDGVTPTDLVSVSSTGSDGYGTRLSSEITHETGSSQYSIAFSWDSYSSANQICGVRVAYYAPITFGTLLPLIHKNSPS